MHDIAATMGSSAIILIGIIFGILFNQRALERFETRVDARFAQVDARFAQVDARFNQIDVRLSKVEAAFDTVNARLDQVGKQIQHLETRLTGSTAIFSSFSGPKECLRKQSESWKSGLSF